MAKKHWFHQLPDSGESPAVVKNWERLQEKWEKLKIEEAELLEALASAEEECQRTLYCEEDPESGWSWEEIENALLSWNTPVHWVGLFKH